MGEFIPLIDNPSFETGDFKNWISNIPADDEWQAGGMSTELDAYAKGWRGLWEHLLHVLYGRPIRTRRSYRFTFHVKTTVPTTLSLDQVAIDEAHQ